MCGTVSTVYSTEHSPEQGVMGRHGAEIDQVSTLSQVIINKAFASNNRQEMAQCGNAQKCNNGEDRIPYTRHNLFVCQWFRSIAWIERLQKRHQPRKRATLRYNIGLVITSSEHSAGYSTSHSPACRVGDCQSMFCLNRLLLLRLERLAKFRQ